MHRYFTGREFDYHHFELSALHLYGVIEKFPEHRGIYSQKQRLIRLSASYIRDSSHDVSWRVSSL